MGGEKLKERGATSSAASAQKRHGETKRRGSGPVREKQKAERLNKRGKEKAKVANES